MVEPKPPLFPNVLDDWPNWKLLLPPPPKADMIATVYADQRGVKGGLLSWRDEKVEKLRNI